MMFTVVHAVLSSPKQQKRVVVVVVVVRDRGRETERVDRVDRIASRHTTSDYVHCLTP